MICNVKLRPAKKHKITFPLPILVIQNCRSWMHADEYNDAYHEE